MSSIPRRDRGGHKAGKFTADGGIEFRTHGNSPNHHLRAHETSSSAPSSELRPKDHRNRRNTARGRGYKPQFRRKSEKEGPNCGFESELKLDSSCDDDIKKNGEDVVSGSGSRLNQDSHIVEVKVEIDDSATGVDKAEGLNSDDAFKRLEELWLSVEELELSEAVLNINNQLQQDEILAMESIYGENIFILENHNGLKCFQVHIHVDVPKELCITAEFNSNFDEKTDDDDSPNFSYSFRVEYLQPIILTCLLPKSYPSNHAPCFTISVQWLNSLKIFELCRKLDSVWQEQVGQEVIYHWVEWLHSCSLSHLGFGREIVLGPYGVRYEDDSRAISGSVSPDVDIPSIKSYNDEQKYESFQRNIQECRICFGEYAGSEFVRLPCHHFFCWKCMKTFTDMHIAEGTVLKIQCPETKCGGMIPPGLLKRLLGEEEFERWESLMLDKTLASMSDVVCCPRCETPCLEDEDNHAQCSKCYYSFCTLCRERRHVGFACMTPDMKLLILQERQNSTSMKDEQRRREQDMINQLLSAKEIARSSKLCPSCKMAISRTEGCNKMVCDNCGQYFCYRCGRAIAGYEHFREGSCELFPKEEIQRWETRMNVRQIAGQIQVEMFTDRGQPCPGCGQNNVKMGNNNHIFCWACQNHYCYLCRKMVRRSSEHYGPKGCKQHTVG